MFESERPTVKFTVLISEWTWLEVAEGNQGWKMQAATRGEARRGSHGPTRARSPGFLPLPLATIEMKCQSLLQGSAGLV